MVFRNLLINILLVDDHALFSKSLEIALSDYSEIDAFDSINDVSQLDNFIVSKKPDIILMDINLKNISSEDGLELAKQILSCYPEQTPNKWRDFFREEDSLLCALDRTFDAATVYLMKGESYRGRNLKTYSIEISDPTE